MVFCRKDRRKKEQLELGPRTEKQCFRGTREQSRMWGVGRNDG